MIEALLDLAPYIAFGATLLFWMWSRREPAIPPLIEPLPPGLRLDVEDTGQVYIGSNDYRWIARVVNVEDESTVLYGPYCRNPESAVRRAVISYHEAVEAKRISDAEIARARAAYETEEVS